MAILNTLQTSCSHCFPTSHIGFPNFPLFHSRHKNALLVQIFSERRKLLFPGYAVLEKYYVVLYKRFSSFFQTSTIARKTFEPVGRC